LKEKAGFRLSPDCEGRMPEQNAEGGSKGQITGFDLYMTSKKS